MSQQLWGTGALWPPQALSLPLSAMSGRRGLCGPMAPVGPSIQQAPVTGTPDPQSRSLRSTAKMLQSLRGRSDRERHGLAQAGDPDHTPDPWAQPVSHFSHSWSTGSRGNISQGRWPSSVIVHFPGPDPGRGPGSSFPSQGKGCSLGPGCGRLRGPHVRQLEIRHSLPGRSAGHCRVPPTAV